MFDDDFWALMWGVTKDMLYAFIWIALFIIVVGIIVALLLAFAVVVTAV